MALTILYEVLKLDTSDRTKQELIEEFDKVLSLDLQKDDIIDLDEEVLRLIEQRKIAKKNKNFEEADKIRDTLLEKGIKLIDGRDGTTYQKL